MAFYEKANGVTALAGSALTIYRFVAIAADGLADHVGVAQGVVDGICGEEQPTVGGDFPMIVADGGFAKVEAGAAIALGALIASDNVGRAITYVEAAGNTAIGKLVDEPALAAGDIVTIHFILKKTGGGA